MKIKHKDLPYDIVAAMPAPAHIKPKKPNILFRTLLYIVSIPDLLATRFRCRRVGMDKLGKHEPCLYLMNHSSFIDLKIVSRILYPRAFNIVCTSDGFVGKRWLMRNLGCIPTKKFITDTLLVRDMLHAVRKNRCSVLMYPEASYSFDGTATPLPDSLGKCIKMLGVPVVMIKTEGAFTRDPLYNSLQRRRVRVSAEMKYLISADEIAAKTADQLNEIVQQEFSFDNFRWQRENRVRVPERFRADGLNRVLYKCPHCHTEGDMQGKGTTLTCHHCGIVYELDEYGALVCRNGEGVFDHVPDWYAWQRDCVRQEIEQGTYHLCTDVDIYMMVNTNGIYRVGGGTLTHSADGFRLVGCDDKLSFTLSPAASYSLYADYFWYEIGDMICIGDTKTLYYCFPKNSGDIVAKTRLATEELYKLTKAARQ